MTSFRFVAGVLLALSPTFFGCGSSSTSPTTPTPSASPGTGGTASFQMSPAGGAVLGVTVVTLTATGSATLTYQWDFGDGSSGTGQTVAHTYNGENTFTIILRASDGTMGQDTVTVKSLSGSWGSVENAGLFQWNLVQSGSNLAGADTATGAQVLGSVRSPRHLDIQESGMALTGRVEEGLDSLYLTWNSPAGPQEVRLLRQ